MKEKTKKIILFIVMCLFTLFALIVVLKLYDNKRQNDLSISNIDSYLTEIKYEEIDSYVLEQPKIMIYVSNSSESTSLNFEKNFIKVIKKHNLENDIIYININGTNQVDPVYQNAPELVIYKDGTITDVINCNTLKSENDIINSLTERGIIND